MGFRTHALVAIAGGLAVSAANAGDPQMAVTVYNHDLGLVRETRTIELGSGESSYSFADVAAQIDPTSVHLRAADGKPLEVLEQNFEYDLLSSTKLMRRHLEKQVEILLEEGDLVVGELLSYEGGSAVIRGEGERLTVIGSEGIRRIDLAGGADGFYTKPTLVWTLDGSSGKRDVEIEYLTGGMSWHAEYVALANEANTEVELAGWVSVENRSGAEYRDARLKLMAGDVHRAQETREYAMDHMAPMAAKMGHVEERSIFEYHLYEIARPVTVRKNQVKQVAFVPNTDVGVVKEYIYKPNSGDKIKVILRFENREKNGLGIPLPAGVVRVFQDDGHGGSEFIGEDRIDHTPRNEEVELLVGHAFDIVGERKLVEDSRVSDRVRRQEVEIRIRNRKEDPVQVKVSESIGGDWKIETETHSHLKDDAHTAEWMIDVPADGETVLNYKVRIHW